LNQKKRCKFLRAKFVSKTSGAQAKLMQTESKEEEGGGTKEKKEEDEQPFEIREVMKW